MAERTVICEWCGTQFTAKRSDARFCSHKCRYGPVSRRGLGYQRTCEDCGTDISHRMGNARFCEPCYAKRPHAVHAATQLAKRPWLTHCQGCGAQFDQPRQRKFCEMECAGKHNRQKQLQVDYAKVCTGCGEQFVTQDNRRTECGAACSQWVRHHPGVLRILDRECVHCLTPFRARTAAQKYCQAACGVQAGNVRRRVREAAQYVEDVSKGVVAKRDKWICQLCHKRVNKTLSYPHPMSWSLDHIIPVSHGGEHSYANTQLAHLVCNVSKGNRTREPVQLALIG